MRENLLERGVLGMNKGVEEDFGCCLNGVGLELDIRIVEIGFFWGCFESDGSGVVGFFLLEIRMWFFMEERERFENL